MDTWQVVITGIFTFLGGGAVKALIDHWGKLKARQLELTDKVQEAEIAARAKKLEADLRGEDTARHFLEAAFTEERSSHKACLLRVSTIEAAMFRQQDQHLREKDRYEAQIEKLTELNARLTLEIATMREALLASFVGETDRAKDLLASIPPPPNRRSPNSL